MPTRGPTAGADQHIDVTTADGWRLTMQLFRARGPERRHTVVCCHGMGANHLAFHPAPHMSLARYLSERGYRVLLLDLRGHGASERASWRKGPHRYGFGFEDYLKRDIVAALAAADGGRPVHWIGHSMGGVLLLAHLATGGSRDIVSGITLGSSLDYSGSSSGFRALLPFRNVLSSVVALPVDRIAGFSGRLAGWVANPYQRFNVWTSNVDLALWRRIAREGFHPISTNVMVELASAMEPGGLRPQGGGESYLSQLGETGVPVLCVTGDKDAQCPPAAAARTAEALRHAGGQLMVCGPARGDDDHYGHFDMLIGKRAGSEVFPQLRAWLDRHDNRHT